MSKEFNINDRVKIAADLDILLADKAETFKIVGTERDIDGNLTLVNVTSELTGQPYTFLSPFLRLYKEEPQSNELLNWWSSDEKV